MTEPDSPPPEVRRSADRPTSVHAPGVEARHSFSFGAHYDPANLGFGPMVCHDDHTVAPGHGYDEHPHADLEIVTWVLDGVLVHRSPTLASSRELGPGAVQALSAGAGIVHTESADPTAPPARFVQTWLRPDAPGTDPSYAATEGPLPAAAGLHPVAGEGTRLALGAAGATLWVARPADGGTVALPGTSAAHLYLPRGTGRLEDGTDLGPGDAVRLWSSGGRAVTLDPGAELLVWSFAGTSSTRR